MGWLANKAEQADLKVGKLCVDYLAANFPELKPRLVKVFCNKSDKSGERFTHWAVTLTNQNSKDYFFHRCLMEWKLTMQTDEIFQKRISKVNQADIPGDCNFLAAIAVQNAEDKFSWM